MSTLRPELEELPPRMKTLSIDDRGYPVPWFVDWLDGKPEFRAMSMEKWRRAVRAKLCWVCGERMGRFMTFVVGPMCGINRISSEPPSHLDCAEWSVRNCPFLNNPDAIRRTDDDIPLHSDNAAGIMVTRNPGVSLLWTTKDYEIFPDPKGRPLIMMGEPTQVQWYAQRKRASRAEVLKSIETGIYSLEAVARLEEGGLQNLQEQRNRFDQYLPTI